MARVCGALASPNRLTHGLTRGWQSVSENSGDALRPEAPLGVLARRRDCSKHEARLPACEHKAQVLLPVLPLHHCTPVVEVRRRLCTRDPRHPA